MISAMSRPRLRVPQSDLQTWGSRISIPPDPKSRTRQPAALGVGDGPTPRVPSQRGQTPKRTVILGRRPCPRKEEACEQRFLLTTPDRPVRLVRQNGKGDYMRRMPLPDEKEASTKLPRSQTGTRNSQRRGRQDAPSGQLLVP